MWNYAKLNGYDMDTEGFVMPEFADLDKISGWALEAMTWAVKNELFVGNGDNTLTPVDGITREEAAKVLVCFADLKK